MDKKPQVIVVGGGAAGLMAAIWAAKSGDVLGKVPRTKPGICQGHSVSVFAGRYFEIF